jgi:hypothetical protein
MYPMSYAYIDFRDLSFFRVERYAYALELFQAFDVSMT